MTRLTHWWKGRGLATQWFLILFATILSLFAGLMWKSLADTEALFKNQVVGDARLLTERTNQFLDAHMNHIQSMLLYLSSRTELLDETRAEEAIAFLRQYSTANYAVARAIYFVRPDGRVYSDQQMLYDIRGNPQLPSLYRAAVEQSGIQWTEPYESRVVSWTVAFAKAMPGKDGGVAGVVVMELDLPSLTERLTPLFVNSSQTFMVLSPGGGIVANDRKTTLLPLEEKQVFQIKEPFLRQLEQTPTGVTELGNPGGQSLVAVKSNLNSFRWSFILLIDKATFYQNVAELYRNYRDAAVVLVLLLLIVTFAASRYFVKPISWLAGKMDRVQSIEFFPNLPVRRRDEIGTLIRSYNGMLDRIRHLILDVQSLERSKKEIELKLLQSQIRPHFLYNTLATIHNLAKQQRMNEVGETIRNLSGLLTFTFDKRSECIPLADELEGLGMYAQIQQVRYPGMFALEVDVPPAFLHCPIPKLTLQPLVENAIFHGVVPREEGGLIRVTARLHRGKLKLAVCDNGLGMSRERRRGLLRKREPEGGSLHGINSVGVVNVHHRLQLYYGEPYGLKVRSRPGAGTTVWVTLPFSKSQNV